MVQDEYLDRSPSKYHSLYLNMLLHNFCLDQKLKDLKVKRTFYMV